MLKQMAAKNRNDVQTNKLSVWKGSEKYRGSMTVRRGFSIDYFLRLSGVGSKKSNALKDFLSRRPRMDTLPLLRYMT